MSRTSPLPPSVFRRRKEGWAGDVAAARKFLADVELQGLAKLAATDYPKCLNEQTQKLIEQLPTRRWGNARKAINIFVTMARLNRYLYVAYDLDRFQDSMEVALDNVVERKLRGFGHDKKMFPKDFPMWESISALDPANSGKYQQIADSCSKELAMPRGELDPVLWEPNGK